MSEENNEEFSTRELTLAAVLSSLGFKHIGTDYQFEGDRPNPVGYFKFENTEELKEVERKFWANELSVEPRTFMGNIRGIKSQIESIRKSPHSRFNKE
jgi:hypothetical protein